MLEGMKKFPTLVGATAFSVAFNAAFFSIFGLSKLFSGAFWSVVFMASSLEVGKLADIIAVDQDPTENIHTMESVTFVMKEGVIYKQ